MSDALRRTVRTFAQAAIGALLVQLPADGTMFDLLELAEAGRAAAAAGTIAALSYLHNWLEDTGRVRSRK